MNSLNHSSLNSSSLTSQLLLYLSQLHGRPVGREPDRVEFGQGLEQGHHFGMIPMCGFTLVTKSREMIMI